MESKKIGEQLNSVLKTFGSFSQVSSCIHSVRVFFIIIKSLMTNTSIVVNKSLLANTSIVLQQTTLTNTSIV